MLGSREVKHGPTEKDQDPKRAAMEKKSSQEWGVYMDGGTRGMVHGTRVLGKKPLPIPRRRVSVLTVRRSCALRSLGVNHRHVRGGSVWAIKTYCPCYRSPPGLSRASSLSLDVGFRKNELWRALRLQIWAVGAMGFLAR